MNDDKKSYQLTSRDIIQARIDLDDIVISPFINERAKGVGYNISMTRLIYSITRNRLVPIVTKGDETYFNIRPNETILGLSYEYLKVSENIAGIFQSRVRTTASGLSGTSTTLDPGWKGMLQLTLNNPTSKKIKVVIEKKHPDGNWYPCPFITMIIWKVNSVEDNVIEFQVDNPPMHLDIWNNFLIDQNHIFYRKNRKKFYDIINYLSNFNNTTQNYEQWIKDIIYLLNGIRANYDNEKIIAKIMIFLTNFHYKLPKYVSNRISFANLIFEHKKQYKNLDDINNEIISLNTLYKNPTASSKAKKIIDDILKEIKKETPNPSLHNSLIDDLFNESIELIEKEILYQNHCNQIKNIHDYIKKNSCKPIFEGFNSVLYFVISNFGNLIAIPIIVFFAITSKVELYQGVLAATLPLIFQEISRYYYNYK